MNRTAVIAALGKFVPAQDIDSLGKLMEWYLIMKMANVRQEMLTINELKVGNQVFSAREPCKQAGHIKSECIVKKVPRCYEIGHDDPYCTKRRTYADAINSALAEPDTTPPAVARPRADTLREVQLPVPKCRACKQPDHTKTNGP